MYLKRNNICDNIILLTKIQNTFVIDIIFFKAPVYFSKGSLIQYKECYCCQVAKFAALYIFYFVIERIRWYLIVAHIVIVLLNIWKKKYALNFNN